MLSRMRRSSPFALLAFIALAGCGGSSPRAGAPASTQNLPAETLTAAELTPGSAVSIERGGQWLPGSVVAYAGPHRIRVHFEGYGPEWDEEVGAERLRRAEGIAAPGGAGTDLAQSPAPLVAGDMALVDLAGRLMLSRVVEVLPDARLRVQYDGFEPAAFEDVLAARLRRPFAGASAHAVGADITVRAPGSPPSQPSAPARVVAVVSQDRWLVRFEGAGAAYDRVVGPDMLVQSATGTTTIGAAEGKATAGGATLSAGEQVFVSHRGSWHPAMVVALRGAEVTVRYDSEPVGGTDAGGAAEENVSATRVIAAPGTKKAGAPFVPKELVYVEWHGTFVEGQVLRKTGAGQYKVRFEGTGPASDEIVVARRLRPRP